MTRPGEPPQAARDLVAERQAARERRDYARADALREELRAAGWLVNDTPAGPVLTEAPPYQPVDPATLPPRWEEPDRREVSVVVHVAGWPGDVARAVAALAAHCGGVDYEVVLVDDGAGEAAGRALEDLARADERVRVLHLDPARGFGEAMNLGMGQALGRVLVWLDPHVEATGDLLGPLLWALDRPDADQGPEVDAVEGYLLAVPRALASRVEVDPGHRYYRNADLDYCFAVRALGYRAYRVDVPARQHQHRAYHETDPTERDRSSKKNYDRFLARWKQRTDLLTRGFRGYHRHS
jgi:GT2 family glycosyltransferase